MWELDFRQLLADCSTDDSFRGFDRREDGNCEMPLADQPIGVNKKTPLD